MSNPALPNQAPEGPLAIFETDQKTGRVYFLDHVLPMGSAYDQHSEIRKLKDQEFTLDQNTLNVLDTIAHGVDHRLPTLLEGPTSASKTSAIEYLSAQTGNVCHRINLKGQTDTSEFIGKFVPNPAAKEGEPQLIWQDGLLTKAMKEGHWIILDELNLAEPQIIEALNSVLEKHPSLTLTDNGGIKIGPGGQFPVHSNFRVFATMNPGYTGRQAFSPAFQNRWVNRAHIAAPGEKQLNSMLLHHTYGVHPEVSIRKEKYQGMPNKVTEKMKKIGSLPKKAVEMFYSRLAVFHAALAKMAEDKQIGRDLDPGHIFTRRDLTTFLDYIVSSEQFNRRTGQSKNLVSHPAEIIRQALELVYLNKLNNDADLKKVENLLKTSKLDQSALSELFKVPAIQKDTGEKAKAATSPDSSLGQGLGVLKDLVDALNADETPSPDDNPHLESLRERLAVEYAESVKFNQLLGLLPESGPLQYRSEVTGKEYQLPDFEKVKSWLTEEQLKLIQQMEFQGLEPQLQITPIGYSLATLKTRIDAKKEELKGPGITTFNGLFVWEEIKENELKYAPANIAAAPDGKSIFVEKGLSKAEWIAQNDGFIIEIVAMKSDLSANPALQQNAKGEWLFNGDQTANLYQEMMENGYSGLSFETYALAGAQAVKNGKPLDQSTFTILPESNLPNSQVISAGNWGGSYVHLYRYYTYNQRDYLRCRRSVRVLKP